MWKQHTPEPFSNMPDAYAFMVKHSMLWRLSYEVLQPRAMHLPYLSFFHAFMAQGINEAFDQYQPDLVVSPWSAWTCRCKLLLVLPAGAAGAVLAAGAASSSLRLCCTLLRVHVQSVSLCAKLGMCWRMLPDAPASVCARWSQHVLPRLLPYLHHPAADHSGQPHTPRRCLCTR